MKLKNYATYGVESWVTESTDSEDVLNVIIGQAEDENSEVICIKELMYKDVYDGIKDGVYKVEADVTKIPHVMVTCEGEMISHNELCDTEKATLETNYNKLLADQNNQLYAKDGLSEISNAVEKNTLCGFKANMLLGKLQELELSDYEYRLDYLTYILIKEKEKKVLIPDDEVLFNMIKEDPAYVAKQLLFFKKREITQQELRESKIFDKYSFGQIEPELYRAIIAMGEDE